MMKEISDHKIHKYVIREWKKGLIIESFQLQMGFSFSFLRANNLRLSLLNIRARSFLLSCT